MQYIFEFNQEKLLSCGTEDLSITVNDALILHYIINAVCSNKMKKTEHENVMCVWVDMQHLLDSLPILNISKNRLCVLLKKYKDLNLIISVTIAENKTKGSRAYIGITDKLIDCLSENIKTKYRQAHDQFVKIQSDKRPVCENTNSDKSIKSNKGYITVTNVTVTPQAATTPKHSRLIPTISNDDAITEKPKKKGNLYTKCLDMIESFTDNEMVRDDLRDYLKLLLEMKNNGDLQRFYANSFKGMLNNLADIAIEPEDQHIVIRCSIDRGYKKFIPLEDAKRYKSGKFVSSRNSMAVPTESGERYVPYMTEEDYEKESDWIKEMEARGKQVRF